MHAGKYDLSAHAMSSFGDWCQEWAAECLRVLKPGGHLLAFGGPRTWHRLACGIEDAGFEVRDSIAWLYGSGFPKSLDVSKAIDKLDATGERRERALTFTAWMREAGMTARLVNEVTGTAMGSHYITANEQPSVATADLFDLLRPHLPEVPEHIEALVRQRTVESKNYAARAVVGQRATGRGTGRGSVAYISDSDNRDVTAPATEAALQWQGWGTALKPAFEPIVVARKPLAGTVAANVLAHGTGGLNIDATRIDSGGVNPSIARRQGATNHLDGGRAGAAAEHNAQNRVVSRTTPERFAEARAGEALGRWPANVILDEHQADELDQQSGTLTSGANPARRGADGSRTAYGEFGGQEDANPARGADAGGASRFFYTAKAATDERITHQGTAHPTVKPLALMRWLVRLVTPPGGTVLEPFAGSGTTVEACILEGFRCVAIEREADYLPLITQRINRRRDPVAYITAAGEDLGLFGEGVA